MSFNNNNNGTEIVISTPLRTAIGTFGGALKGVPAVDLGTTVATEVLNRTGLDPERVDQVIVGNCLQAGQGMNPARQVGINAGIPPGSPAMTINRDRKSVV
jgi:acetyl-CoA C-acetyltransferase